MLKTPQQNMVNNLFMLYIYDDYPKWSSHMMINSLFYLFQLSLTNNMGNILPFYN